MAYNESKKERTILSIVLTKAKENPLTELLSPKGGLLYLVLTAHEPSIKPLANIVSCYICSDRQYKRKNTFHFSHLPSRINGRARPQSHYTTLFAKKIQETMPRAEFSDRGKSLSSYNLSVSLRSTAPLVGEPLAKPFTLRGLPKPPLGRGGGTASAVTERLSPAAAHGQACKLSAQCLTFAGNGI